MGMILLPLHTSVFLFFSGLIVFLFTISKAIAIVLTVAVALTGLLYATLTILPIVDDVCLFFTPMSDVWWYLQYSILSGAASGCYLVLEWFRNRSDPYYFGDRPSRLSNWSEFFKDIIERNKLHLKDGIRGNIFWHAKTAPASVDLSALTWLLQQPILGEMGKLEEFIYSIPPQILVQLSSLETESGNKTIRDHLLNLFQGCLGNKDKRMGRSQRLQICLDSFYQIVKSSSLPYTDHPEMVLQFVWSSFKDLDTVRMLWDDSDPAIRLFSRSICAHLSRNILRKSRPDSAEQSWLRVFVGKKPEDAIFDPQLLNHLSTWDHFVLESFVFGVFPCPNDGLFVEPEHATCFLETLVVLMNAGNSGALSEDIFSEEIASFIEWAKEDDNEHHDGVAAILDKLFSKFLCQHAY
jgi:hypothetical protein